MSSQNPKGSFRTKRSLFSARLACRIPRIHKRAGAILPLFLQLNGAKVMRPFRGRIRNRGRR